MINIGTVQSFKFEDSHSLPTFERTKTLDPAPKLSFLGDTKTEDSQEHASERGSLDWDKCPENWRRLDYKRV